ncbi:dihydrofolate reductase family protein [Streptomyces sp. NPDC059893]|uniref:dihydrofolate reductase family protein n=1 Tax=Streptomyces sp. NPDC059893 TaxID=3346990 RepID=UPI0036474ECD
MALGGADLAATFMEHGLMDEFRLFVHPVLIGGGKPLVPASGRRVPLRLVESLTFGNGVELLRCRRASDAATWSPVPRIRDRPGRLVPTGAERVTPGVPPEVLRRATRWPG